MLQCVAVCCSQIHGFQLLQEYLCCRVLHCVAACCSVLACAAVEYMAVSCCRFASFAVCCKNAAVCCGVLLCVAVCCSVLQCVAVRRSRDKTPVPRLCCSMLQCVAVCRSRNKNPSHVSVYLCVSAQYLEIIFRQMSRVKRLYMFSC